MRISIENFSGLPDQVRENALAKIEHADPRIEGWGEEGDDIVVTLSGGAAAEPALTEQVRKLIQETIDSYRFFREETLAEEAGAPINEVSPYPELLDSQQVSEISPGTFVYQGDFARRLATLDDRLREMVWARGGMEQSYPTTVPTASLAVNGYLSSYPQHAIFVAALHRDVDTLNTAGAMTKSESPDDYAMSIRPFTGAASEILLPAVCFCCFDALRHSPKLGRPLAKGRIFTAVANCHRREDKALVELARLQSYKIREIIFLGDAEFVAEQREWMIEETAKLLRSWGLRFRIVAASDAFFSANAAQKRAYQSMKRLKYECQVHLPHSDTWLACASFNNHEATLIQAYGLDEGQGTTRSGCVGYGLDRLTFAVLSQFGNDSSRWPEALRAFFKEGEAESPWQI